MKKILLSALISGVMSPAMAESPTWEGPRDIGTLRTDNNGYSEFRGISADGRVIAGETKTDARDAAIIAEAARILPHELRTLKLADEQIAELSTPCCQGFQTVSAVEGEPVNPAPNR